MRVFVAGASGAIGRPLGAAVVAARARGDGDDPAGARRRRSGGPGRGGGLRRLRRRRRWTRPWSAAAPEAVIHALTALPQEYNPQERLPRADQPDPDRGRRATWSRRLGPPGRGGSSPRASPSSTRREGGWVKDEEAPLFDERRRAGSAPRSTAMVELERQVLDAEGIEGVVLRYGWLYGPGTYYDRGG